MDNRLFTRAAFLLVVVITFFKHSMQDCAFEHFTQVKETLSPGKKIFSFPNKAQVSIVRGADKFHIINNTLFSKNDFSLENHGPKMYNLSIKCTSDNKMKLEEDFIIAVGAVNEFPPTFPLKKLSIDIPETTAVNSSILSLVGSKFEAIDEDVNADKTKPLTYAIGKNAHMDTFQMTDSKAGKIRLKKKLDYEVRHTYVLNITASDGEKLGFALLSITIKDEDTKPPAFSSLQYQLFLPEEAANLVNTSFATEPPIHAYDQDIGINQTINYRIHKDTANTTMDMFALDSRTGEIVLLNILDRETKDTYTIFIEAYQTDAPFTKTAVAIIHITVLDINDNLPKFHSYFYNTEVLENTPDGFFIFKFYATDADKSPYNMFEYKLRDRYSAFQLNSTTGELTVKNSSVLDREAHSKMYISVYAVEKTGNESKHCQLSITLLDVNDNWPVFSRQGFLLFATDLENGTYIGTVNASDADEGKNGELRYGLTNLAEWGKQPAPIYIGKKTGMITANSFLKAATTYRFFLRACDSPTEHLKHHCSKVPVMIVTKNTTKAGDGVVVRYIYIKENTPNNTKVADLRDDFKDTSWSMIFIHLKTSPVPIKIMKFGEVLVNGPIDYESVKGYKLTVLACTETATTNMTVYIHVRDVNDHTPTFEKPEYIFEVLSKMVANTVIGHISAFDRDGQSPNNEFSFEIPGKFSISDHILVENKTGNLVVKKTLLLDSSKDGIEFLIKVVDKGTPSLSSLATVKLVLEMKDDTYLISTVLLKKHVESKRLTLEKTLTDALGVNVVIKKVVDGATNSRQKLLFGGSTLQLSATYKNGTKISREGLKSLVTKNEVVLQEIFNGNSLTQDTGPWQFSVPEISLLILASFLFVCCIICIYIICIKHKMEMRTRRLLHNLSKEQPLYNSLSRNGINEMTIINPAFESDSDSGHGNGDKTDRTEETDTGFQTSTVSADSISEGGVCNGRSAPPNNSTHLKDYSTSAGKSSKSADPLDLVKLHGYEQVSSMKKKHTYENIDETSNTRHKHTYENIDDPSDSSSDEQRTKNIYDKPDVIPLKGEYPKSITSLYDSSSQMTQQNVYDVPNNMSSNCSLYDMYDKPDAPQANNSYDKPDDYPVDDIFIQNIEGSSSGSSHIYSNVTKHHYEHVGSGSEPPSEPHPDYITTGSEVSNYSGDSSGSVTYNSHSSPSTTRSNFTVDLHSRRMPLAYNGSEEDLSTPKELLENGMRLWELDRGYSASSSPVCPLPPRDYHHKDHKTLHLNNSMTRL